MPSPEHCALLLDLAWGSIRHGLDTGRPLPVAQGEVPPELWEPRATFVTLKRHGDLRGCMGRLEATRPLAVDLAGNAFAAAFQDSRFPPLAARELEGLELHISLLTRPEPILFTCEADLLRQLVPGRDGVILEAGARRGTFLPSVWEELPRPEAFLDHLKRKAGLPGHGETAGLKAYRYFTEYV